MNINDIADLPNYLYGIVYHFMGRNDIAKPLLAGAGEDIADNLLNYITKVEDYNKIKTVKKRVNIIPGYYNKLSTIKDAATKTIKEEHFFDEHIFSRTFFQKNGDKVDEVKIEQVNDRLKAALYYILRSHCNFRPDYSFDTTDLAAAKHSFNDLIQADMLLKDLVFYFDFLEKERDIEFNTDTVVLCIDEKNKMSYGSLLFSLRCICTIFKGNVCKKIYFNESALEKYMNALELCNKNVQITDSFEKNKKLTVFPCSTIASAYFEVSKLLFDKGKIIDALLNQIRAIIHLLTMSSVKDVHEDIIITSVLKACLKTERILRKMRCSFEETFRRDTLLSLFISPELLRETRDYLSGMTDCREIKPVVVFETNPPVFCPKLLHDISNKISEDHKPIIADILARIGFVLYTIREDVQIKKIPKKYTEPNKMAIEAKLREYNNKLVEEIKTYFDGFSEYESELGKYTLSILNKDGEGFLSRKIERVFSSCVVNSFKDIDQNSENMSAFCDSIAQRSLINIGNISSIPIRVSKYLYQSGYKDRTGKDLKRPQLNKFVVLRRWQSFNPKVPSVSSTLKCRIEAG